MSEYPPETTPGESGRLKGVIKDWALANGLTVRPPPSLHSANADPAGILATPVSLTLFPSPFPRACFDQAATFQKTYNKLYASISQDEEFLARVVKEIGDSDDFITELWRVHLRVKEEGYVQHKCLGLFRSDYMVHQDGAGSAPKIKQVEFNTIASSFGGLSSQTSQLHKYLASTEYPLLEKSIKRGTLQLPANGSAGGLAAGIRHAFVEYGTPSTGYQKCVIFLVQGGERNIFDQRHLEYELQKYEEPQVPVFRLLFSEILQCTSLADGLRRQLLYHPPEFPAHTFEVAVVYMRSGYGPGDYPDQSAWEARYHLERSAAIKCPTVLTQVAGTKKVQQVLTTPKPPSSPSILGRYLPDEDSASTSSVRSTFTNIYPLDETTAGVKARQIATDPELCKGYVLKPQREGGGNNIYRSAIPAFLKSIPEAHWPSYILMELITPPAVKNTILRNGNLERGGVICELGVYGTCVWDQQSKNILHNAQAGYLLRTKGDQSEEGGVAAGFGCMDSCNLV
ncbi:glutathione synthase [Durotheca rogersii]|uniref:glutathione synthase n=1 Tax=Durotheca rogersii TaxID=419775 RepID=UPI0022207F64|nr:glutathione synthase [Durotheca rogersii]KAI5864523.1 glutathione synthase [Durotheca rogersii]